MAESREVRFTVDDEFMKKLQEKLGQTKTTEIAKTALTILNWAVEEANQGRVILSSKPDGSEIHRLAVPGLTPTTPR